MRGAAISPSVRADRDGRIGTSLAVLALMSLLTGCSNSGGNQDSAAATSTPTASEFQFGGCNSVTDAEVSQTTSLPSLTRVVQNPIGCRWEGPPAQTPTYAQTWWYRGSPLAVEKSAAADAHLELTDITVEGLPAFEAHSTDSRVCEVTAGAEPDLVAWTVGIGDNTQISACDAARALTSSSITRGLRR
ncbi:DUF3558 domain-containing protein [Prescottella agglutinans]|uniref:DUF3558 domain-containing protein n=1 Tax=Prescottella agglutinans TaxID=1644129 RepID=A0ABT6MGY8_9NOCA|nr:DUF3558 domain-containing protein [Prescottella agglutinans]MDH6283568.1 hypothetical protein [Prescottella agglutinans]